MKKGIGSAILLWLMATISAQVGQTPSDESLVRLANSQMIVEFDKRTGALYSLREAEGRSTNYIGNTTNHPGTAYDNPTWTGHIVSTVWELDIPEQPVVLIPSFSFRPSGRWRKESTGDSADIRSVTFDREAFTVRYAGQSKNDGGIRSFDLGLTYRFAADQSLLLEIDIANTTGRVLEIGELG